MCFCYLLSCRRLSLSSGVDGVLLPRASFFLCNVLEGVEVFFFFLWTDPAEDCTRGLAEGV